MKKFLFVVMMCLISIASFTACGNNGFNSVETKLAPMDFYEQCYINVYSDMLNRATQTSSEEYRKIEDLVGFDQKVKYYEMSMISVYDYLIGQNLLSRYTLSKEGVNITFETDNKSNYTVAIKDQENNEVDVYEGLKFKKNGNGYSIECKTNKVVCENIIEFDSKRGNLKLKYTYCYRSNNSQDMKAEVIKNIYKLENNINIAQTEITLTNQETSKVGFYATEIMQYGDVYKFRLQSSSNSKITLKNITSYTKETFAEPSEEDVFCLVLALNGEGERSVTYKVKNLNCAEEFKIVNE